MRTINRRDYVFAIPDSARAIPGYPRYYATPDGQIFSACGKPKRRRFGRNSSGYPICGMRNEEGMLKFPLVHRIIAEMFVPGDRSLTVNHKDMDKTNCAADNLEWITFSENHLKGHAMKPEWSANSGALISRVVVATNPATGERHEFKSGRAAAVWVGNPTATGNISKACVHGRIAYGFTWAKA